MRRVPGQAATIACLVALTTAAVPCLAAETKAEVWASELEPADFPGAKTFKENAHFHVGSLAVKTLYTFGH